MLVPPPLSLSPYLPPSPFSLPPSLSLSLSQMGMDSVMYLLCMVSMTSDVLHGDLLDHIDNNSHV